MWPQFEEWIGGQAGISQRVGELFKELFLCYCSKAYKGAMIFSYLAF